MLYQKCERRAGGAGPDSVQIAGSSRDHQEAGCKYRERCNGVETLNTGDTQVSSQVHSGYRDT